MKASLIYCKQFEASRKTVPTIKEVPVEPAPPAPVPLDAPIPKRRGRKPGSKKTTEPSFSFRKEIKECVIDFL